MLGSNWGASAAERTAEMPCDRIIPGGLQADRAINIAAPVDIVFAWFAQLRVAPYSYDLLDNFGRRSPRARDPELTRLAPGQRVMTIFELVEFERDRSMTLRGSGVAVTYSVAPIRSGSRVHVRVRFGGPIALGRLLAIGDVVMMRKQLLVIKELAEREARAASTAGCLEWVN